jgi:hypothetical protein
MAAWKKVDRLRTRDDEIYPRNLAFNKVARKSLDAIPQMKSYWE